jgi:hypothetical protein
MGWKGRVQREFIEADREFVEQVLPVGSVDQAAFGLIAEATQYRLVDEAGEVHLRAEVAALGEVLTSLSRAGSAVKPADAQKAVARFAELWEAKARQRGTWDTAVAQARGDGEVETGRAAPREARGCFLRRLFGRRCG